MPHKIIVLGSMHTKFKLSNFPDYIQQLLVSAHQIFLELNHTEEFKKFIQIDQPFPKEYFLEEIDNSSLSKTLLGNNSSLNHLSVDNEIELLAYLSGIPSHGLDDIVAHPNAHPKTNRMGVFQKFVRWIYRDRINKVQKAYQNGEVEVIVDELLSGKHFLQQNIARESRWMGRILPKLTDDTLLNLVVVGVNHLELGENRFLTLFEEAGWNVEKFNHTNKRAVKTLKETLRVALLDITSHSTLTE